ncbi:type IX secretion system membrane protein PorP/SprF [bacterium]|nr:MAG: type IX secretion system membrane protein PorP/SprF [bacterium]
MKGLLIILLFLTELPASAQLFPISDFYIFNGLIINPAFAGSQDALSTALQYRNQWTGFNDAPKITIFSAHAPLFTDRMGLGFFLARHSFGIYKATSFMGNYAYRMNLYNGKLSFGIAFGITSNRASWSDLKATDPDDILLTERSSPVYIPNFSIGTYYTGKNYFAGISLPFFLTHEPDDNSGKYTVTNKPDNYNYFITGGYTFSLSPYLSLQPSVLLKYYAQTHIQTDIFFQAEVYDRFSMGAGYRSTGMLMGLISCNVNKQFKVSYSYDSDSGKAGKYKKGSHEIMIGYIFRYTRNVMSPAEI